MSQNSPRVQWMKDMISSCFERKGDGPLKFDSDLYAKMIDFLKGKSGKTFVIYYQRPPSKNDKNDNSSMMPYFFINEEAKKIDLTNRAAFFIRNIPDGKDVNFTVQSDNDVSFGEISSENVIGMNKVIYNYLLQEVDKLDQGDWGRSIEADVSILFLIFFLAKKRIQKSSSRICYRYELNS